MLAFPLRFVILWLCLLSFIAPVCAQTQQPVATAKDSVLLAKAHKERVKQLSMSDSTAQTLYHFDSAIRLFQLTNYKQEMVATMIDLGRFLRFRGKYKEALKTFTDAIEI